jgi:hypothetical protein
MRIENLIENNNHRQILRESCDGLTLEQRRIVEGIYNEFVPLIEATLTADQIKQVFGELEKQSVAGGANRTAVGAGVDVAKKANEVINNVGKWLQNTAPVKMADEKFEKLKNDINKKFPDSKLLDGISNLGIWMKENPGKSAAIIGVLTAIASLAGGPVGGAIAGQVLRGAAELIKGEKLSTAVGKGIKTAVFGYLSGKAFEMLGKFAETLAIKQIPFGPEDAGFEEITIGGFQKTLTAPGMEWTRTIPEVDVIVDPEMASALRAATNMLNAGGDSANEGFEQLSAIAKVINSSEYRQNIIDTLEITRKELIKNDSLTQFISAAKNGLQAASQGAVAAATGSEKKESYYVQTRPLSEGQVYMIIDRVLTEAGFMDKLKAGATKAVGAVAKGADWVGKQATEKVTSAKLLAAWKMEGSPTDSEEFKQFLLNYGGIEAPVVDKVFTDLKISAAPAAQAAQAATGGYAEVKKAIAQLNTKDRKRMIAYLTKQLGTA